MEQNAGLTVAIILLTIAVLMQAGAMLGILLAIRKIPGQLENVRSDVMQRLDPLTRSALEIANSSRDPLRAIASNLAEISKIVRDRTVEAGAVAADLAEKSRVQAVRVDAMVTGLAEKVEHSAEAVHRGVLVPIGEIAAAVKGVRSGLEFLFWHRRVANLREATRNDQRST
jgi:hypothetical protein